MNPINNHEIIKNPPKSKDAKKNPQELYDIYTRKGDEAIIAEDIILAERHYQHADHYFRLMNDPTLLEAIAQIRHSTSPYPVEKSIAKALKGITAERAAREKTLKEKGGKAAKVARQKKKDTAIKAKAAHQKEAGLDKIDGCKKEG